MSWEEFLQEITTLDNMELCNKVKKTGGKKYQLVNATEEVAELFDKTIHNSKKKKNNTDFKKQVKDLKVRINSLVGLNQETDGEPGNIHKKVRCY